MANKMNFVALIGLSFLLSHVEAVEPEIAARATSVDCSNLDPSSQQFASQLSAPNKIIFCGQFTDAQRSAAMQMMGQKDSAGHVMTADQVVQKIAAGASTDSAQKAQTPKGCLVK